MTKKDLFTLLLKFFGLYILIQAFFSGLIINLMVEIIQEPFWPEILVALFSLAIIGGLVYIFLFKAGWLVSLLHLDYRFRNDCRRNLIFIVRNKKPWPRVN